MIDPKKEVRMNLGVYLPSIATEYSFKSLEKWDKWAMDEISRLQEAIGDLQQYRKELFHQWQALESSRKHKRIELLRRTNYYENKVYIHIIISTVFDDMGADATQEEKRLTYKGKDRFEAYKEFEKQMALYPGAEIIDYRKKK